MSMKCFFTNHSYKKASCGTKVLYNQHGQLAGTHFLIFTLKRGKGVVFNRDHTTNLRAH